MMTSTKRRKIFCSSVAVLILTGVSVGQIAAPADRTLNASEIQRILTAIEDEIYDYGYQNYFEPFSVNGERGLMAKIPVYIAPNLHWNSVSWQSQVIYKYPPFGEVKRAVFFGKDIDSGGYAALGGKPSDGFPWNRPDSLTLYLNDDEICDAKHTWSNQTLEFYLQPSAALLEDTYARQRLRVGQSYHGKHNAE